MTERRPATQCAETTTDKRAWAVFGGAFDPPHVGHVLVASYASATYDFDRVLVVPTFEHPHQKHMAPFRDRKAMLDLAFSTLRNVAICDLEEQLGGASYTIRTLNALQSQHPAVQLRLVVGADLVAQIPAWKNGADILRIAPPFVVGRQGHGAAGIELPGISSTEVRRRLRANENVDAMVPRRVLKYIRSHHLYGTGCAT